MSGDAIEQVKPVDIQQRQRQDIGWLVGQDIRRTWVSYIASAAYLGLLSLLIVAGSGIEVDTIAFEIVMFAVATILWIPFFSRHYMSWHSDPVAERLTWLRSLPISVRTITRSRMLANVPALPLNVIAFFLPIYLAGTWSLGDAQFLWFVISLIGISLIGAGINLCLELAVSLRRWLVLNVLVLVPAIALMGLLAWRLDFMMVSWLAQVAGERGPLLALMCVALGVAGYVLLGRLAEDLLRRRELET